MMLGVAGDSPAEGVAKDRNAGCSEGKAFPPANRFCLSASYAFSFANFFIKSTRAFTPSRVIAL